MRIATWNVNGIRARLDFVRHFVADREPDVLLLQELKAEEEHFPAAELEDDGYRAVVHAQRGWNGVAVLARGDVDEVTSGLPEQHDLGARYVVADVRVGDDALRVASVYCPNGKSVHHDDFPAKLAFYDALGDALSSRDDGPFVLGGDFNVCPGPLDTHDEERLQGRIFHTDDERTRYRRLLGDGGLVDVYRERHPEGHEFSWWDYRGGAFHRGLGLRIDMLLATPGVARRALGITIDRHYRKKKDGLTASDHAPVWMDVE